MKIQSEVQDFTPWPVDAGEEKYSDAASTSGYFHVDRLKEKFRDFARPNLYKVEFEFNAIGNTSDSFLSDVNNINTSYLVKSVNLPSFGVGKQEIKRMGESIFIPTNQVFQELQMSLICDDNYTSRKFLHAWLKRLVYDTDNNIYKKITTMAKADVIIRQFDQQYNVIFGARFEKCFPVTIGEIQLSQDSDTQVVEFPATFSYSRYTILSPNEDGYNG